MLGEVKETLVFGEGEEGAEEGRKGEEADGDEGLRWKGFGCGGVGVEGFEEGS